MSEDKTVSKRDVETALLRAQLSLLTEIENADFSPSYRRDLALAFALITGKDIPTSGATLHQF